MAALAEPQIVKTNVATLVSIGLGKSTRLNTLSSVFFCLLLSLSLSIRKNEFFFLLIREHLKENNLRASKDLKSLLKSSNCRLPIKHTHIYSLTRTHKPHILTYRGAKQD